MADPNTLDYSLYLMNELLKNLKLCDNKDLSENLAEEIYYKIILLVRKIIELYPSTRFATALFSANNIFAFKTLFFELGIIRVMRDLEPNKLVFLTKVIENNNYEIVEFLFRNYPLFEGVRRNERKNLIEMPSITEEMKFLIQNPPFSNNC